MVARKLTLSVDGDVIEAAKAYASERGTSVSRLVEGFLSAVSTEGHPSAAPPVLARLRGSMKDVSPEDHHEHRATKYL
jgi:hypothetical protein